MAGPDQADGGLANIEHIVVLMLENRSFDHMLGYLSLERGRSDVDGLAAGMTNSARGRAYPIRHLSATHIPNPHWDPNHSAAATDLQIGGGAMDGFAESFARTLEARRVTTPPPDPGMVMGYFDGSDLPVYDHLAAEFCVCDRWHSSVPGATWPNRLYAVTGAADGSRDDKPKPPPIYDKRSFVRHLDAAAVDWRWYTYDIGTLRCVDREYLIGHHERFSYVDKPKLPWQTALEEELVVDRDSASFVEDAQRGTLAPVSWIDPNFKDVNLAHAQTNDDHPPSDVGDGQELVLLVYNALAGGPKWNSTLLVVVYDEHGGFFDHVPPPAAVDDDPTTFGRYGIRVPALVVSPWVGRSSVAKTLFDHTTIIKTILTRFCPAELEREHGLRELIHWLDPGHPHYMGKRVVQAADLGPLLSEPAPRPAPDREALVQWLAARQAARARAVATAPIGFKAEERLFTDLQHNMLGAELHLRQHGLPFGQP
jgi:phospholipase C